MPNTQRLQLSRTLTACTALAALCALDAGCTAASAGDVRPRIEVVDRSRQALSAASLKWINGSYSGCIGHSGRWSARISGIDAMDYDPLTVTLNDTGCSLTMIDIVGDKAYTTAAPMTLGADFSQPASPFGPGMGGDEGPLEFYANAALGESGFGADFSIVLMVSDDLNTSQVQATATYATVTTSSVSGSQVPSPNYTIDFTGVLVTVDANGMAHSASGTPTLNPVTQTGETYVVIANTTVGATYASVDDAFNGASTQHPLSDPLNASDLVPVGSALPLVSAIIIAHQDSGVSSYQLINVTFQTP
ncbi:MAG: hypothetical protein ACHREM_15150 [Polyangiales bacterium]